MLQVYHRILLLAMLLLSLPAGAQTFWEPAGIPGRALFMGDMQQSPTGDTLILGGAVSLDHSSIWFNDNPMLLYTQGRWEELPNVHGHIYAVAVYRDTIVVGGHFLSVEDSIPAGSMAYYAEGRWRPMGFFGGVIRRLHVIDGVLYAAGGLNDLDGAPIKGLARWNGSTWTQVGNWDLILRDDMFIDFTLFRGQFVAIGLVEDAQGRGIAYLDTTDNQWKLLGPGILGGMSGAHCLAVYQDDLYVGGQFQLSAGNAGQEIMRWDGEQFHAVGTGLQAFHNDFRTFCDIRGMSVHDGLLFVTGGCDYAGDLFIGGVAVWDGHQWCASPGQITGNHGYGDRITVFQDTLYVVCRPYVNGPERTFVNMVARHTTNEFQYNCQRPLGTPTLDAPQQRSSTINQASLLLPAGIHPLRVLDLGGRLCLQRSVSSNGHDPVLLDLRQLPAGSYWVSAAAIPAQRVVVIE